MITATDYLSGIKNAVYDFNEIPSESKCEERVQGFCPFRHRPTVVCKCGLKGMLEHGCIKLVKAGEAVDET